MNKQKTVEYVLIGLALVLSLIGSYFDVALPRPDIPDIGALESDIEDLQGQVDVLQGGTDEDVFSFGVGIPPDVVRALRVESTLTVDGAATVSGGITGDVTGDITGDITGDVTGDLTGDVTGDVTGDLTGNVTGNLSGNITSNTIVTGNTSLSGTLTLESVAFSGPVTFGSASNAISGTLIAHGLATTPTAVLLTPSIDTMTETVYVQASNATSFTVGLSAGSVATITTLYWLAGK